MNRYGNREAESPTQAPSANATQERGVIVQFPHRVLSYLRGLIDDCVAASPNKRQILTREFSPRIGIDPEQFGYALSGLDILRADQPRTTPVINDVEARLTRIVETQVSRSRLESDWPTAKLQTLVELGISDDSAAARAARVIETALFDTPKTIEQAVDLYYAASWAMVSAPSIELMSEFYDILSWQKDWFTPHSMPAMHFLGGRYAADDTHLRRYHGVRIAMNTVRRFLSLQGDAKAASNEWAKLLATPILTQRTDRNRNPQTILEVGTPGYSVFIDLSQRNTDRFDALYQAYDSLDLDTHSQLEDTEMTQESQWPYPLITGAGEPLVNLVKQRIGSRIFAHQWPAQRQKHRESGLSDVLAEPIEITDDLKLDLMTAGIRSREQRNELVREVLQALLTGSNPNPFRDPKVDIRQLLRVARAGQGISDSYDQDYKIIFALWRNFDDRRLGRLASILEYHRPALGQEQVELYQQGSDARVSTRLRRDTIREIDERGFYSIITDPKLRNLGYRAFIFREHTDPSLILAAFEMYRGYYKFLMDYNFKIKPGLDVREFKTPEDEAWLRALAIDCFINTLCLDPDALSEKLVGGDRQARAYRRQITSVRGYVRRHTRPGDHASDQAKTNYVESRLRRILEFKTLEDLSEYKKQTGEWPNGGTYVQGYERLRTEEHAPVVIAPRGSDNSLIRSVVDLGSVSAAETQRLEDEILSTYFGEQP